MFSDCTEYLIRDCTRVNNKSSEKGGGRKEKRGKKKRKTQYKQSSYSFE
jgi:hypothetical protein